LLIRLRSDYFHEFNHSIPLGNNYWAYLLENDAYDSFSEIFVQQEYLDLLPDEPTLKVLDIGAHYGYFSLWLQSKNPDQVIKSLLIESSFRCLRSLKKLISDKKLNGHLKLLPKAVGNPQNQITEFYDRPYMAGSLIKENDREHASRVKTLQEVEISDALPPPYDLIKCDIEGAEWEFLLYYSKTIKKTRYILMEWHSWHRGGGGINQVENKLQDLGFEITKRSSPIKAVGREGEVGLFLAKNLNFQN
jgi:FkbM family methyltransferase